MRNLITLEQGTALLNAETAATLAKFEQAIKSIKEAEENLKMAILNEMEALGVVKIDTDELTISYIAATDREKFDSKAFRRAHADLYDEYVSMIPVKASIRVKVK